MSISTIPAIDDNARATRGQTANAAASPRQNQASNVQLANEGARPASAVQVAPVRRVVNAEKPVSNAPQEPRASAEELKRATEQLQRRISVMAPELEFSVDEESGRSIIKLTDPTTKEVIRQIPSEQALKLNQALDQLQGLLLNRKA